MARKEDDIHGNRGATWGIPRRTWKEQYQKKGSFKAVKNQEKKHSNNHATVLKRKENLLYAIQPNCFNVSRSRRFAYNNYDGQRSQEKIIYLREVAVSRKGIKNERYCAKNTVPLDCFRFVLKKSRLKRWTFPHFLLFQATMHKIPILFSTNCTNVKNFFCDYCNLQGAMI